MTANEIARTNDWDQNGVLTDEERDADGDGLMNFDETHGRMVTNWWKSAFAGEPAYLNTYAGTNFLDPDTDGDGVLDGADDQDNDLWPNLYEVSRATANYGWDTSTDDGDGVDENPLGKVNPFNPCLPQDGRDNHCAQIPPFGVTWELPQTPAKGPDTSVTATTGGVFTSTAHGYTTGDRVVFSGLTGGDPELVAGDPYFVIATNLAADTFSVALTPAGTLLPLTNALSAGTANKLSYTYNVPGPFEYPIVTPFPNPPLP
jgi:hypothetical protein